MDDNKEIMVNDEVTENTEIEGTDEYIEEDGGSALPLIVLGGAALAAGGAFVASRTKWGKAKLHEIRVARNQRKLEKAQKNLEKLAAEETQDQEPKNGHVVIEENN